MTTTADVAPARRMSAQREGEVLATTLELLERDGYESLTMDAVAAAAHTSKATIYRQWQGKPGLVIAALGRQCPPVLVLAGPGPGSLRDDLLAMAEAVGPVSMQQFKLMAALAHAALGEPELGDRLRECVFEPVRAALAQIFARAVERGEVAAGHPVLEHLPSLLLSAGLGRPLIEGEVPDAKYLVRLIDEVVVPLLAPHVPPTSEPMTPGNPRAGRREQA